MTTRHYQQTFFRNLIHLVMFFVGVYTVVYFTLGAWLAASLFAGIAITTYPFVIYFEKKGYYRAARILFLFTCVFYILATPIGIGKSLDVQYYFLPAALLPIFLFRLNEIKEIILSTTAPLIGWIVLNFNLLPSFSNKFYPVNFPDNIFIPLNFLGAYIITSVILYLYSNYIKIIKSESHKALEEAQAVANVGSWSYELSSKKIEWSKQMRQIFPSDQSDNDLTFESMFKFIHPDDLNLCWDSLLSCIQQGEPFRIRYRSIFENETTWVEALGRANKNEQGEIISISGTCQNITELVSAEEKMYYERSKALHNAKLASLGEVSAGIAHEINNPLAVISSAAQTCEKHLDNPDKVKQKIDSIQKATLRITKIVSGLRKFSRSADRQEYKIHYLKSIIDEALVIIQPKLSKNQAVIKVDCPDEISILCNDIEIEQVLINMISNSLDATSQLPERWIEIKVKNELDCIVLQIKDSGSGIPEKVAQKLFQPFFTTKPIGKGTGLGLSIVKGILDAHGAGIDVIKDSPNTCFEIRFSKKHKQNIAS